MAQVMVQLNFRLPVALNEKLEALAKDTGKTKTEIVATALEEYFERAEKKD
jgi:predicted DNA-binding protein